MSINKIKEGFAIITYIYLITNIINGKQYIGQTINFEKRIETHKNLLNSNKHYNKYLQCSYNKYGKDAFEFSVLKKCEVDMLNILEIQYIEMLNTFYNGYNLTKGGLGSQECKPSDETRLKMKESRKGKIATIATKQKISESKKGKLRPLEHRKRMSEGRKGIIFSEEHRKHMSESGKGRIFSQEHRQKIGEDNKRRIITQDTKQKISDWAKKRTDRVTRQVSCGDEIFNSLKECALFLNIKSSTLCGYLLGYDKIPKKFAHLNLHYIKKEKERKKNDN